MDRRRRHAAAAQHARRLVGRRQHRQRPLGAGLAALVVGRDRLDPRGDQPAHQVGEQHGLARPRLADHRQRRLRPAAVRQQRRLGADRPRRRAAPRRCGPAPAPDPPNTPTPPPCRSLSSGERRAGASAQAATARRRCGGAVEAGVEPVGDHRESGCRSGARSRASACALIFQSPTLIASRPVAGGADHVRAVADPAVDPRHPRVEHAERLARGRSAGPSRSRRSAAPPPPAPTRPARGRSGCTPRSAGSRSGRRRSGRRKCSLVIVRPIVGSVRIEPACRPLASSQIDVQRVEIVVLVTLPAVLVDSDRPSRGGS